jgi:hypothetical protein
MSTYKLPVGIGGGDVELLTDQNPTRLVDDFVWVRHEVLGLVQVERRKLVAPLPPEPEEGAVVMVGETVLRRKTFATYGPEMCWRAVGDEDQWSWRDICHRGTPVRLVPDPAASAPDMPWSIKDGHGDELTFKANEANDRLMVGINDEGNDYVNLHPNDAAAAGRALLRWAGVQR